VLFKPDNYEFEIRTSLSKDGKAVAHWVAWQGGFGDQSVSHDAATRNVVYQSAGTFERVNLGSMEEAQEVNSARAGVEDQYFLAMFLLPKDPALLKLRKQDYAAASGESVGTLYLAVPAEEAQALRVYVGPKDERWLRRTEPQLAAVIDYGFFEVIARPLIFALLWIHSYVGNFGWAIIILTVIINFLLFPLRLKQQISMQKMQKVQPQMRTLQDRYKKLKANDPKRAQIQAEMMNLYKEHGVNPMGGCLPLLLQMPFLFAFWSMLSVSIELRRAPWIAWWIDDLSRYDSTFILPILMTVSMIIMQKMTPTTVDPAQAKMMMIMPVILSVMFLWVQSGLMLYWLTSNVVGIGQQYFINKYWGSRAEARAVSRPARRELRAK
jgi:YidC/Oxa1 family membrane protein insertase